MPRRTHGRERLDHKKFQWLAGRLLVVAASGLVDLADWDKIVVDFDRVFLFFTRVHCYFVKITTLDDKKIEKKCCRNISVIYQCPIGWFSGICPCVPVGALVAATMGLLRGES